MQIGRDLGGYSKGRTDLERGDRSKKKREVMIKEKEYLINGKRAEDGTRERGGCERKGVDKESAEAIFNQMVSFAEYAFNKSHAAAYAVVAYETGYLKAHYPVEFMAALMTSVMGDAGSIAKYMRNCTEMGIEVLPPDINESSKKFSVVDGKIRFGLLGVKNVGEGAIDAIIEARRQKGKPKDIFRFIEQLDIHRVNKKAVESLIKAGALDCLDGNRAAHMGIYEKLMESAQSSAKHNVEGQLSLFQLNSDTMETSKAGTLPDVKNFDKEILIAQEKEMLGVYITDHPLKEYEETISRAVSVTSQDLADVLDSEEQGEAHSFIKDGMNAVMAGIITAKKTLITKSSKMMAFVDMEDLLGTVEVVVFPNVYERYGALVAEDSIVAITGTINFKEGEVPKLLAEKIVDLRELKRSGNVKPQSIRSAKKSEQPEGIIKIKLPEGDTGRILEEIKVIMQQHKGRCQAIIYMPAGGSFRTDEALWVQPDGDFRKKIVAIVGEANYKG